MKPVISIAVCVLSMALLSHRVHGEEKEFWDSEFTSAFKAIETADYDKAFDLLKSVSQRFPKDSEGFLKLASIYNRLRFYNDSALARREATKVRLDISRAWCKLGNALWDQGEREKGIEALREAVRFNPDDRMAHHDFQTALWQWSAADRAIDKASLAIKEKPDDAEAWYQLAIHFRENGQTEDAEAALSRAIQLKGL